MHLPLWKSGVVVGVTIGLWHACWAALVALQLATPLINFILAVHFLSLDVRVTPFDIGTAALLVGVTAVVGFVVGVAFAFIWNALHPKSGPASV